MLESWFFGGEGCTPRKALEYVSEEAALCGASKLEVERRGAWWSLKSAVDWLPHGEAGVQAFRIITPYEEGGPNAFRMEILLTAFAKAVTTFDGSSWVIISDEFGDARQWIDTHSQQLMKYSRVIAFRW
jgi:hypothetical protein